LIIFFFQQIVLFSWPVGGYVFRIEGSVKDNKLIRFGSIGQ